MAKENVPPVRKISMPREGISGESFNINKIYTELPKHEKSVESEELIKESIQENAFLKENLRDEKTLQAVVDAMYLRDYPAGRFVIKEGEPGLKILKKRWIMKTKH